MKAIVSSNLNNKVHTTLSYLNVNNTVTNTNANNGSQLLTVDYNIYRVIYLIMTEYIT
ncbi:MAG: hypothetical protein IJG68_01975 [Bacilli bacterium]|nr:hypothetical protein [Bacilli bacterium]